MVYARVRSPVILTPHSHFSHTMSDKGPVCQLVPSLTPWFCSGWETLCELA